MDVYGVEGRSSLATTTGVWSVAVLFLTTKSIFSSNVIYGTLRYESSALYAVPWCSRTPRYQLPGSKVQSEYPAILTCLANAGNIESSFGGCPHFREAWMSLVIKPPGLPDIDLKPR
jgi:hypothetical protein